MQTSSSECFPCGLAKTPIEGGFCSRMRRQHLPLDARSSRQGTLTRWQGCARWVPQLRGGQHQVSCLRWHAMQSSNEASSDTAGRSITSKPFHSSASDGVARHNTRRVVNMVEELRVPCYATWSTFVVRAQEFTFHEGCILDGRQSWRQPSCQSHWSKVVQVEFHQ